MSTIPRVDTVRLREMLIKHEGIRLKVYKDTVGKLTIGVGRNIDDIGISQEEAMLMLSNDIDRVLKQATDELPWFNSISTPRQDVVCSMIFNMGLNTFKEFKKLIAAIQCGNFDEAANQMLCSTWAAQVKSRAVELAEIMKSGFYKQPASL